MFPEDLAWLWQLSAGSSHSLSTGTSVLLGRAGTCSGEAAALCPAAQTVQGRGAPMACAKTKAFQSESPCNLPSGLPTCATGNWKWKLPEKCVHVLSAYLGRQVLPSGSANLLSQPVLITPQQAEAAAQEVPPTSATSE